MTMLNRCDASRGGSHHAPALSHEVIEERSMQMLRFDLSCIGIQLGLANGGLSGAFSLKGERHGVVPFGDGFALVLRIGNPIVFTCREALLLWVKEKR